MDMYTRDGELYHHGILKQKWGVKHGPPYPLSNKDRSASEKSANKESKSSKEKKGKSSSGDGSESKSEGKTVSYDDWVQLQKDVKEKYNNDEVNKQLYEAMDKAEDLHQKVQETQEFKDLVKNADEKTGLQYWTGNEPESDWNAEYHYEGADLERYHKLQQTQVYKDYEKARAEVDDLNYRSQTSYNDAIIEEGNKRWGKNWKVDYWKFNHSEGGGVVMDFYTSTGELYHHGINGMKWGKRNGPPYPLSESKKSRAEKKEEKKAEQEANYSEDYKTAHSGKDPREMSTQELNQVSNRLDAEQRYDSLMTKSSSFSKGAKYVAEAAAVTGSVALLIKNSEKLINFGKKIIGK